MAAQRGEENRKPGTARDLSEQEQRRAAVFRQALPSVARIEVPTEDAAQDVPPRSASGLVWDSEGHIVTSQRVVEGVREVNVELSDGTATTGRVVAADRDTNLAVLKVKVPENLTPVTVGSSDNLQVGQDVYAIGYPYGRNAAFRKGMISALNVELREARPRLTNLIQSDLPLSPGDAGGALLDASGQLIGINTATLERAPATGSLAVSLPVETVERVAKDLIEHEN